LSENKAIWVRPIEHEARWCTFHADGVIIAGPNGVTRLRRSDGMLAWQFLTPEPTPLPTAFPEPALRTLQPPPPAAPFSSFRLAASRLFFHWGTGRLLALDVETGDVLWQLRAPGASVNIAAKFNEHYLATADHMLLQTAGGECLAVSADNGRIIYRRSAPAEWPAPRC